MANILFVADHSHHFGGVSVSMDILQHYLNKEGFHVDIVGIYHTKIFKRLGKFWKMVQLMCKTDAVHIHATSIHSFYSLRIGRRWAFLLHKPLVVTYHSGETILTTKRRAFSWFTHLDKLVVMTQRMQNVFAQHHIPSIIIPNIIEDHPVLYERESVQPRFISIRSLGAIYNVSCIIKAFALIKPQLPDALLFIVGNGANRERLREYVEEHRIPDVFFFGHVPNQQIPSLLKKADILVSAPIIDNMPVSLLEAFHAGLLVISSNVGGVPEILKDGENGYLFESMNERDLAQKMLLGVYNQEQSLRLIRNAKERAKQYSWPYVRTAVLALYSDLTNRSHRKGRSRALPTL